MSVYDFTHFKTSRFAESIVYTVGSTGVSSTINAVVSRQGARGTAQQGANVIFHPIVVHIDRADIQTVTEMKDTITTADINGTVKTFAVKKIIYSDAGCFKVGL